MLPSKVPSRRPRSQTTGCLAARPRPTSGQNRLTAQLGWIGWILPIPSNNPDSITWRSRLQVFSKLFLRSWQGGDFGAVGLAGLRRDDGRGRRSCETLPPSVRSVPEMGRQRRVAAWRCIICPGPRGTGPVNSRNWAMALPEKVFRLRLARSRFPDELNRKMP